MQEKAIFFLFPDLSSCCEALKREADRQRREGETHYISRVETKIVPALSVPRQCPFVILVEVLRKGKNSEFFLRFCMGVKLGF
jgi:hypothetical protein